MGKKSCVDKNKLNKFWTVDNLDKMWGTDIHHQHNISGTVVRPIHQSFRAHLSRGPVSVAVAHLSAQVL